MWFRVLAVLLALALAAGWLTSASDAIHQSIYQARLADAARLESESHVVEAAMEFRHALELRSDSFPARLGLTRCLTRLNRWPEAQQHLIQLRAVQPANGPVLLLAARTALRLGGRAECNELYQRAVYGHWPEAESAQRLEARMEWVRFLASYDERQALFAELVRLTRDVPLADVALQLEVASLLLRSGHPSEAAEALRLALTQDRKNYDLWLLLGESELASGRLPEARRAFANASSLRMDSSEARDRYNLVTAALVLDPSVRRLSLAQRESRTKRLLAEVRSHLDACSAALNASAREQAQKAIARPLPRALEEQVDLAEATWQIAQRICPPLPRYGSPLPLVFESLGRMPE